MMRNGYLTAIVALAPLLSVTSCAEGLTMQQVDANRAQIQARQAAICRGWETRDPSVARDCWAELNFARDEWNNMRARQERDNAARAAEALSNDAWTPPSRPYTPAVNSINPAVFTPPTPLQPTVRTDTLQRYQPPPPPAVIHCVGVIRVDPGRPSDGCE